MEHWSLSGYDPIGVDHSREHQAWTFQTSSIQPMFGYRFQGTQVRTSHCCSTQSLLSRAKSPIPLVHSNGMLPIDVHNFPSCIHRTQETLIRDQFLSARLFGLQIHHSRRYIQCQRIHPWGPGRKENSRSTLNNLATKLQHESDLSVGPTACSDKLEARELAHQ